MEEKNENIEHGIKRAKKAKAEWVLNSKHVNQKKVKKVWKELFGDKIILIGLESFLHFFRLNRKNNQRIKLK